jgi:hypothetical protein
MENSVEELNYNLYTIALEIKFNLQKSNILSFIIERRLLAKSKE